MKKKYLLFAVSLAFNFAQGQTSIDPATAQGSLGSVTFTYEGSQVTYTTVRAKDGNIWLQQNMGSTNVAAAMTDETSYGDLFQWGRWADGHQNRDSAPAASPAPNNPAGLGTANSNYITGTPAWWSGNALTDTWTASTPAEATETNGCDPCKALGNGWAMPTQADWTALVDAESFQNPTEGFASNLKLPASGSRGSGGTFTGVGQRGYFWSSTTSSTGGKYFFVGTTLANPSAGASRGQGSSVRCVKKAALGIGELTKNNFKLYPNPTNGIANIQTDFEIENVSIYNQLGQLISSQKNNQIDLSKAPNGMYVAKIKFENGQSAAQKIIKK